MCNCNDCLLYTSNAVEEVIRKLVKNPKFEEAILNKIGSRIDTEEIEKEIEGLEKQHRQLTGAKARLGQQMDSLEDVYKRQALEDADVMDGYIPTSDDKERRREWERCV